MPIIWADVSTKRIFSYTFHKDVSKPKPIYHERNFFLHFGKIFPTVDLSLFAKEAKDKIERSIHRVIDYFQPQ